LEPGLYLTTYYYAGEDVNPIEFGIIVGVLVGMVALTGSMKRTAKVMMGRTKSIIPTLRSLREERESSRPRQQSYFDHWLGRGHI
jgi:hypothetical protein